MQIKIKKWGNSLAIRIPKSIADNLNLEEDSVADLQLEAQSIIIKKQSNKKKELKQLLDLITEHNLHNEISTGYSLGAENFD